MRTNLSEISIKEICNLGLTGRYNSTEIGNIVGRSATTVSNVLKRNGQRPKNRAEAHQKYPFNEHYFDNIDTEAKAYFLGLFYADGTNDLKKRCFQITLQEKDSNILKIFQKEIGSKAPIYVLKPRGWGVQNQVRLRLSSSHFTKELASKGVVPNKTFKLDFPYWLEDSLICHFIRGLFDGDGYCAIGSSSFTGTKELCVAVAKIIYEKASVHTSMSVRRPERKNNNISFSFGGGRQMWRFYNFIYKDCTVALDRKLSIAKIVFAKYEGCESIANSQYHINTHRRLIPFYDNNNSETTKA